MTQRTNSFMLFFHSATSPGRLCSFSLAALSVVYLWHTLPVQAGVAEAWDDPTAYSLLWLHGTGVVLGVLFPTRLREISSGAFFGQVLWYCSIGPARPSLDLLYLFVFAWICLLMAGHTLACTLGSIIGAAIRLLARGRSGLDAIARVVLRMHAWPK